METDGSPVIEERPNATAFKTQWLLPRLWATRLLSESEHAAATISLILPSVAGAIMQQAGMTTYEAFPAARSAASAGASMFMWIVTEPTAAENFSARQWPGA